MRTEKNLPLIVWSGPKGKNTFEDFLIDLDEGITNGFIPGISYEVVGCNLLRVWETETGKAELWKFVQVDE